MAIIKSSIVIIGTIGGINYYVDDGKNIARKAGGGFNSRDLKTKSSMAKPRGESSELKHCSKLKAAFRTALVPYFKNIRNRKLHWEMVSMFHKIKVCDRVSEHGKRNVAEGLQSPEGVALLGSYAYPKGYSLSQVLGNRMEMNWETGHCLFQDFKTNAVSFPTNATHVGLLFSVIVMDYVLPASEAFFGEEYYISRTAAAHAIDLATLEVPTKAWRRVGVLGVRFYQEVNGTYHALEAKRGLAVFSIE